jgi:hypothetical protein
MPVAIDNRSREELKVMSLEDLLTACVERMQCDWFSLQYYPSGKWVAEMVVIGEPDSEFGDGKTAREALETLLFGIDSSAST